MAGFKLKVVPKGITTILTQLTSNFPLLAQVIYFSNCTIFFDHLELLIELFFELSGLGWALYQVLEVL